MREGGERVFQRYVSSTVSACVCVCVRPTSGHMARNMRHEGRNWMAPMNEITPKLPMANSSSKALRSSERASSEGGGKYRQGEGEKERS